MAGDGAVYTWDDRDLQRDLSRMGRSVEDMSPAMKAFAEYMVKQTDERFENEEAPDGSKWQELKPATIARKKKISGAIDKILQQYGHLRLVHPKHHAQSAGVFSNRVYAAIHNRGGMAGPGRRVKIPQREFLGFSADDLLEFYETVKDWVILGKRA